MRLLIDSHAIVWMLAAPAKLSLGAAEAISDSQSTLFISLASIWELANKVAIGRLPLVGTSVPDMIRSVQGLGVTMLPIEQSDVIAASTLPPHHLDPFDRMLVAQAQAYSLTLVTNDRKIPLYDVQTIW